MISIFKKIVLYGLLLIIGLEILVRVFHLHNEYPFRYADEQQVEKWVPNQLEYSITGNRKQNVGKYRINNFGFNSAHDSYESSVNENEIALVGDSFIEGFHENYTTSLGQQIENKLTDIKIFEFGYSGYDLADELHLIYAYPELFNNIDHTFVYLRQKDDLDRDAYELSSRLSLDTPVNRVMKQIKLLVYLKDIGALASLTQLPSRVLNFIKGNKQYSGDVKTEAEIENMELELEQKKLENFKILMDTYPLDKNKYTFFIDKSITSTSFLAYLEANNYKTLDLNQAFKDSKEPSTLIYDQHWSKNGRKLVAELIANYLVENKLD